MSIDPKSIPATKFKVLVVGDKAVGKTNLITRYTDDTFSISSKATIGIDFKIKVLDQAQGGHSLQLWDIGGDERFGCMTRTYYKEAHAALIVLNMEKFDTSLEAAKRWKLDIDDKLPDEDKKNYAGAMLIANKIDLKRPNEEQTSALNQAVDDNNFLGWRLTSAKTGEGVALAVNDLFKEIVNKVTPKKERHDTVSLQDPRRPPPPQPGSCSC